MHMIALGQKRPRLGVGAWVATNATLVGDVEVKSDASVWYGAVLRADDDRIIVGAGSNVQDGCVLHADSGLSVMVGASVSVGHCAILHGCTVESNVLIGMGAQVLNGSIIGSGSLVAAGAVVREGSVIPPNSMVAGVPGKVRRETTSVEREHITANAQTYLQLKAQHARAAGESGASVRT